MTARPGRLWTEEGGHLPQAQRTLFELLQNHSGVKIFRAAEQRSLQPPLHLLDVPTAHRRRSAGVLPHVPRRRSGVHAQDHRLLNPRRLRELHRRRADPQAPRSFQEATRGQRARHHSSPCAGHRHYTEALHQRASAAGLFNAHQAERQD